MEKKNKNMNGTGGCEIIWEKYSVLFHLYGRYWEANQGNR